MFYDKKVRLHRQLSSRIAESEDTLMDTVNSGGNEILKTSENTHPLYFKIL